MISKFSNYNKILIGFVALVIVVNAVFLSLKDFSDKTTSIKNLPTQSDTSRDTKSVESQSNVSYPLLVTNKHVYDQNQRKILSFDKVQNTKNKFVFLGGFGNLATLDSIKNFDLVKFGNDYVTHDGKNLIIAPKGDFEKSYKVDLKKDIVQLKSFDDRLFITVFDKEKCDLDINSKINLKTCKFDLYSSISPAPNNMTLIASRAGYLEFYGFANFIPSFAEDSGFWITSGFGDSCGSRINYFKYDYYGKFIDGFTVAKLCGEINFSNIDDTGKEVNIIYSSECDIYSDNDCKLKNAKLEEISLKYIPNILINPVKDNFECGKYSYKDGSHYFDNIQTNTTKPDGEFLGCVEN